jgi:hypothetical protein
VASAARKELSVMNKSQTGHSERWMDSVGDVKELLRAGSSNMIKILHWLRFIGLRMALLFLARNTVPWNERDRGTLPESSLERWLHYGLCQGLIKLHIRKYYIN